MSNYCDYNIQYLLPEAGYIANLDNHNRYACNDMAQAKSTINMTALKCIVINYGTSSTERLGQKGWEKTLLLWSQTCDNIIHLLKLI